MPIFNCAWAVTATIDLHSHSHRGCLFSDKPPRPAETLTDGEGSLEWVQKKEKMNTGYSLGTTCLSRGYILSHQLSSYKVFHRNWNQPQSWRSHDRMDWAECEKGVNFGRARGGLEWTLLVLHPGPSNLCFSRVPTPQLLCDCLLLAAPTAIFSALLELLGLHFP